MEQSFGKLSHWLAFYLCKGLGIKTLLALSKQHSLESLFSLSQSLRVILG
jgi:DNA processing protein